MIRVLHFAGTIHTGDIIDGVLTRLDRSRFEVAVLTGMPARPSARKFSGARYPTRCLNRTCCPAHYPRMLQALVGEMRRFRPHVLQVHHFHENVVASLAVRLAPVPGYVIGRHYSDHIYYLTRGVKQRAYLAVEAWCNHTARRIAVPAEEVARLLIERQGVPASRVAVIPFGIDLESCILSSPGAPARLRHEHGLEGSFLVVACCRLNPEKGLEFLLRAVPEAAARIPHFYLAIVGSGPREPALRRMTAELRVDQRVRFLGWRDDALDWIAASDAVVQPSMCESFCQVLMEALAFEKPVVMTPVGAAPEVIGRNERGILVPRGDSAAIADALCRLAADRDLGRRMGAEGRAFVRECLSPERSARSYEALYEGLAPAGAVRPPAGGETAARTG